MKSILVVASVIVLGGCTTIGPGLEPIADRGAQVRLSELTGDVEIGQLGVGVVGKSCVLTVIGELPAGLVTRLEQGQCSVDLGQ